LQALRKNQESDGIKIRVPGVKRHTEYTDFLQRVLLLFGSGGAVAVSSRTGRDD
jgi:hypothetical protein